MGYIPGHFNNCLKNHPFETHSGLSGEVTEQSWYHTGRDMTLTTNYVVEWFVYMT